MVKWGFSREEAYFMPLKELNDYVIKINQHYKNEKQANKVTNTPDKPEPKSIGQVNRHAFE